MNKIDTTIDGFHHVGINLTQEQYDSLVELNIALLDESRKDIPVFNTMIILRELGLLPDSMIDSEYEKVLSESKETDYGQYLSHKIGRRI